MTLANEPETPAFVTDEKVLQNDLALLRDVADRASCKLLYSPKASVLSSVLQNIARVVDGFACSSPYELRLLDQHCRGTRSLHLVSPLIKAETLAQFSDRLDYLTVNSLSQWDFLQEWVSPRASVGLRLNPQLSFIRDARYDPCAKQSKLGVPMDKLADLVAADPAALRGITGLHFHSNCEATGFVDLLTTARHIQNVIPNILHQIDWINIGGGYLFEPASDYTDFYDAVAIFREGFGLKVFMEPGAAAVRRCGTIEATVHDIFSSDDTLIAILDTTVNHMPEVFEFQFEPDVLGHIERGLHSYTLAGCTCLAGDVFGHYSFDRPLVIGSRLKFLNMGAYTMSKAHRFNGVALPTLYHRRLDGSLDKVRADGFDEFAHYTGGLNVAVA
jgi:carboxynorspermidine decarboxylase